MHYRVGACYSLYITTELLSPSWYIFGQKYIDVSNISHKYKVLSCKRLLYSLHFSATLLLIDEWQDSKYIDSYPKVLFSNDASKRDFVFFLCAMASLMWGLKALYLSPLSLLIWFDRQPPEMSGQSYSTPLSRAVSVLLIAGSTLKDFCSGFCSLWVDELKTQSA